MKRNLLFAAALMAGVAVSAQELGEMDLSVISSETAVTVPAGTLVAASENLSVFTKFQDDYKTTGVNTDEFEAFLINDQTLDITAGGVTGSANPKGEGDASPANDYVMPINGCCYSFTAPGEGGTELAGYFYVFGKLSTNKQYFVFEAGANSVAYELHMVAQGEAMHYAFAGDASGYLKDDATVLASYPDLAATGWTNGIPSPDQMSGYTRGNWAGTGAGVNGMGCIVFPVYAGLEYTFGAAGSKLSLCGFYFEPTKSASVKLHDNDGVVADLDLIVANPDAISSVESAAEVVAEEYYTVSGVRVAEMVPGLNLVKQTLSDGSVKTVKVIK